MQHGTVRRLSKKEEKTEVKSNNVNVKTTNIFDRNTQAQVRTLDATDAQILEVVA